MTLWLQFVACAAVIFFTGTRLSKYGDIIAEKTGLGKTWIGVILLAATTSLPELITGISSVTIFDVPDIALGNVLGACMVNLLMIAWLDVMGGSLPISARAHHGQVLTAAFGILLLGLVSLGITTSTTIPSVAWVGGYSLLFIVVYLLAMRMIFLYERKRIAEFVKEVAEEAHYEKISAAKAYGIYGLNAALLIGAATYLPYLGERIAEITGLGETFVGSIFIALSTTLPEMVVSTAALKMGAIDMALGNIFGSNVFNILILAVDDILYTKGPLFSYISTGHTVTAFASIIMTAIAIIGLTYRTNKKPFLFAWDALGIAIVYFFSTIVLYTGR